MFRVGTDLEGEEVCEVESGRLLELREHAIAGANETKVDVLRCASALEAQLKDEATLEGRGVAEHGDDPGQKTIEDEELTLACESSARLGSAAKALLQCLLECFWGAVSVFRKSILEMKSCPVRAPKLGSRTTIRI